VRAEILSFQAPIDICRLAAGVHNQIQNLTKELSTADVCRLILEAIEVQQKEKPNEYPLLSDDQLYLTLQSSGVVKEEKAGSLRKKGKSEEAVLVWLPLAPCTICLLFLSQKDHYLQRYKTLSFMLACAAQHGLAEKVLARILALNGELPTAADEIFRASLLKDYGTGLKESDMLSFLEWLVQPSLEPVRGKEKIGAKLRQLKHYRYAHYVVHCPDNHLVASHLRMPTHPRIGANSFFFPRHRGHCSSSDACCHGGAHELRSSWSSGLATCQDGPGRAAHLGGGRLQVQPVEPPQVRYRP
jgi:hypothetical protein